MTTRVVVPFSLIRKDPNDANRTPADIAAARVGRAWVENVVQVHGVNADMIRSFQESGAEYQWVIDATKTKAGA